MSPKLFATIEKLAILGVGLEIHGDDHIGMSGLLINSIVTDLLDELIADDAERLEVIDRIVDAVRRKLADNGVEGITVISAARAKKDVDDILEKVKGLSS